MFAGFVVDEPFSDTFYRAMAVLVAASPCALAIATPSAVSQRGRTRRPWRCSDQRRCPARKSGAADAIAFDKTGTLTEGKPKLVDVVTADDVAEEELLRVAVEGRDVERPSPRRCRCQGWTRTPGRYACRRVIEPAQHYGPRGRGRRRGETTYIGKDDLFRGDWRPCHSSFSEDPNRSIGSERPPHHDCCSPRRPISWRDWG
ncbi:HAD family hydrolase [Halopseudomonas pachastrellae]|nr:HAD family hydrolase [Halopseudomonas pachastrellae]